jgi:hypothetical protein
MRSQVRLCGCFHTTWLLHYNLPHVLLSLIRQDNKRRARRYFDKYPWIYASRVENAIYLSVSRFPVILREHNNSQGVLKGGWSHLLKISFSDHFLVDVFPPWCQSETSLLHFLCDMFASQYTCSHVLLTLHTTKLLHSKETCQAIFLMFLRPVFEVHPTQPLARLHIPWRCIHPCCTGCSRLPCVECNTGSCTFHCIFTRIFCSIFLKLKTMF